MRALIKLAGVTLGKRYASEHIEERLPACRKQNLYHLSVLYDNKLIFISSKTKQSRAIVRFFEDSGFGVC